MSRLLLLALVACSSAEAVTASESTPSTWIDRWVEARDCLVVPAEDLETGVAISLLEGRDCGDKLRALEREVPVVDDPLVKEWRLAITRLRRSKFPSAAQRSVEIRSIENGARLLGALHGRNLTPMARGPALPRAHQRELAHHSGRHFAVESGTFKVTVTLEPSSDRQIAYEIAMTATDGTWMQLEPHGSRYATRVYDSPSSIEQVVEREGKFYLDRVVQDGSMTSTVLEAPKRAPHICHHDGVTWTLYEGTLHRGGAGEVRQIGLVGLDHSLRCAGERALVDRPGRVFRCSDQGCRDEFVSPVPSLEGHASLLARGRWVYAVTLEHVAAIWIEGQQPRYVRLTNDISWTSIFNGLANLEIDGRVLPLAVSKYFR